MSGGHSDSGKRRPTAVERKQKQRDQEELKKEKLREVVGGMMPPGWVSRGEENTRKRKLIDTNALLDDVLQCIKMVMALEKERSEDWCRYRTGMAVSKFVGSLLVRREDLFVAESNAGMEMFAPFENMRGYQGQSLRIMAHSDDGERLMAAVQSGLVGDQVSVRLLRACVDPMSGCLLLQYVRKDLTISHVTPDGKAVLVVFALSDKDTAPLSAAPTWFDDLYRNTEEARGSSRIVSTQGILPLVSWLRERTGNVQNQDPGTNTVFQALRRFSHGSSDSMSHLVEDAAKIYPVLRMDCEGIPVFQMASKLQFQGLESRWTCFLCQRCNGTLQSFASLPGLGLNLCMGLLLPSEGEPPRQSATVGLFWKAGAIEGVHAYYYHDGYQSVRGQLLRPGGRVTARDAYHVREGVPEAELELEVHANAVVGTEFVLPSFYSWDCSF